MTEIGFVKAQCDNLPKIDSFMTLEYFSNNPSCTSAEIRGFKADSAGRESYGDAAVGYVQLKREGHLCIVKAKICPEHKVKSKNYSITLIVDEQKEEIVNATCHVCAASLGGCKHAIAFVMWVHRRSEEPAPTEVVSYWKKPKLAGVGTTLKFLTLDSFGKITPPPLPNPSNGQFLQDLIRKSSEIEVSSQLMKYYTAIEPLKQVGLHQLLSNYLKTVDVATAKSFLDFCRASLTAEACQNACKSTVDQSATKLWYELRYGRVTASRIYEVSRCKTTSGTLVESIVGSLKITETQAMKRGKFLEKQVLKQFEEQYKLKIQQVGFLTSPDCAWKGASPDGITDEYVIEIKCPTTAKTLETYVKDNKISGKYQAQVGLQMFIHKKQKGIFIVADPSFEVNNKIDVHFLNYDEDFIETIIEGAKLFWIENIFPMLVNSLGSQVQTTVNM